MAFDYLDDPGSSSSSSPTFDYLDETPNELTRRSFLSSPAARFGASAIGTGAGAYAGTQAGLAAAPFLGPFAPAGPIVGGILGAGAGTLAAHQARRAAAAQLEYDRPEARGEAIGRSLGYAPQDFLEGAEAQAGGKILGAAAKAIGPPIRRGYLQGREMMTGVHEAPGIKVSERILERGTKIIKPEYREGVPKQISQKVQNGVNVFLERARKEYNQVTPKIKAQLEAKYVNIGAPAQSFRQSLVEANIIDQSGRPLGGLLTRQIGKESVKESSRLRAVLARLDSLSRRSQRGRLGGTRGYVRADEIHRTIKQIDGAVKYSQRGVNPIGEQAEALLKKLRRGLMDDLGDQVPALSARNSKYAANIDLYEDVQRSVTNERVAGTIERLSKRGNEFPFPELREIDKSLPRSARFLNAVQDYHAGSAFAKGKGVGRLGALLTLGGAGFGGLVGHPLAGATTLGTMGALASPALYAKELGLYRSLSPYANRMAPYLESGAAPLISGTMGAARQE